MEETVLMIQVTKQVDGKLQFSIGFNDVSAATFGIILCDAARHGAKALNVNEDEIFDWINKERFNPTSPITEVKPN